MYKGQIKDFTPEIVEKMLENQVKQGNKRDVSVFEENFHAMKHCGGFNWADTTEGGDFWDAVLRDKDFDLFFKKYSNFKDKFQEFQKVIDIEILKTPTSEKRNLLTEINLLLLKLSECTQ